MALKATLASRGMREKLETPERITTTFHPEVSKVQRGTGARKAPRDPQDTRDHQDRMNARFWTSS